MTYSLYNLTENAQLSIRGTTGSHPDSQFVFGIFLGHECLKEGIGGDYCYEDMDWSEAVKMAEWILEENKWIQRSLAERKTYEIKLRGGGTLLSKNVTYEPATGKPLYIKLDDRRRTAWIPMRIVKKVKELE